MPDISSIIELIALFKSGEAPWWIYAAILLIPFSIFIAVREVYCWFNKVNLVVNRLERLDKKLSELSNAIVQLSNSLDKKDHSRTTNNTKSEIDEFSLDKDWTKK